MEISKKSSALAVYAGAADIAVQWLEGANINSVILPGDTGKSHIHVIRIDPPFALHLLTSFRGAITRRNVGRSIKETTQWRRVVPAATKALVV